MRPVYGDYRTSQILFYNLQTYLHECYIIQDVYQFMRVDKHCCLHTMQPSLSQSTIELHSPIERLTVTSAWSSIIIQLIWRRSLGDAATVQFHWHVFIVRDKYNAVFWQCSTWPCCFTLWMGIWHYNDWNDLSVADPYGQNYLHLPVSKILCDLLFLKSLTLGELWLPTHWASLDQAFSGLFLLVVPSLISFLRNTH